MVIHAFITHKLAEQFADCQDRFGVNPDTKSIALSDGMGSTWQQKIWAQLLVDTYTNSINWNPSAESIKPLCKDWKSKVDGFIQELKNAKAPENIIYRNERNYKDGRSAGATFVGIRFNGKEWNGSVLGDSCLITWDGRDAKFHTSQDTEAFDNYPDYFDSDPSKEGKGIPKPISGTITKEACLFLVSDPFSDFLLEHKKQGDLSNYMEQLLSLSTHEDFEALVSEWRNKGMHNDDTTLLIIKDDNSDVLTISYADNIEEMVNNEKLSQSTETIEKNPTPNENIIQEDANDKFNVALFIKEFIKEFMKCINRYKKYRKKCNHIGEAAEKALSHVLEKYSISKKHN